MIICEIDYIKSKLGIILGIPYYLDIICFMNENIVFAWHIDYNDINPPKHIIDLLTRTITTTSKCNAPTFCVYIPVSG